MEGFSLHVGTKERYETGFACHGETKAHHVQIGLLNERDQVLRGIDPEIATQESHVLADNHFTFRFSITPAFCRRQSHE